MAHASDGRVERDLAEYEALCDLVDRQPVHMIGRATLDRLDVMRQRVENSSEARLETLRRIERYSFRRAGR